MLSSDELKALRERYRAHLMSLTPDPMQSSAPFDFSKVYPDTPDLPALLAQVDDLKKCLDSFRPLNPAQAANLQGVYDLEYTYESNRIEGNTLTLRETHLVVDKGLTIGGKPLRDHLEAINHQEAIQYIRDLSDKENPFNEFILKSIHSLILRSIDPPHAGVYRGVPVEIRGSKHLPPQPYLVPKLMEDYFFFYEEAKDRLHPVLLASEMHERLVTVHPFIDGNGRTARLVMNLLLLRNGYPIANISADRAEREAYYDALEAKQIGGSLDDFHRLILRTVKASFFRYLDAASGGIGEEEERKGGYFFERIKDAL